MRVANDGLVNGISTFLLTVRSFKPKRRFRNAIDLSDKIPTLVVKKILTIRYEELQVANLW